MTSRWRASGSTLEGELALELHEHHEVEYPTEGALAALRLGPDRSPA
jgi:hypothetical protein